MGNLSASCPEQQDSICLQILQLECVYMESNEDGPGLLDCCVQRHRQKHKQIAAKMSSPLLLRGRAA